MGNSDRFVFFVFFLSHLEVLLRHVVTLVHILWGSSTIVYSIKTHRSEAGSFCSIKNL